MINDGETHLMMRSSNIMSQNLLHFYISILCPVLLTDVRHMAFNDEIFKHMAFNDEIFKQYVYFYNEYLNMCL